jgi:site-specific DNA recombinase
VPKRSHNASVVPETSAYRISRKSASSESRAFYGNQYGLTFPLFEHYGVPLWVPEVGGPIDPRNEAHDLVMSVFGGMRARGAEPDQDPRQGRQDAQAKDEGRFLGGRRPTAT